MKNLRDIVETLLRNNPKIRNSDDMLVAAVYYTQSGASQTKSMTAKELLTMVFKSELPKADTVLRTKRKLVRKYPELSQP